MIKGIIYRSNTGSTKRYAEMAAEATGLTAVPIENAAGSFNRGDTVLYMGWVQAGCIMGYSRAAASYDIAAVCGVGISEQCPELIRQLRRQNRMEGQRIKLFYLRGSIDIERLNGIQKLLINLVKRSLKSNKTESRSGFTAELIERGGDFVSAESLLPVIEFIRTYNGI